MPSHIPATFASAAASNGTSDGNSGRNVTGANEWSRTRPNGSTQTFRRSSQANSGATRESSQTNSAWVSQANITPHTTMAQPSSKTPEIRYSKEQILEMFKSVGHNNGMNGDLQDILTEGWQPGVSTGTSGGSWSRKDENKDSNAGPDICWESNGTVHPLGLMEMTDEERVLFSASVNSPLKPPPQNSGKENTQAPGLNGRKPSFSQGSGAISLSGSRPGVRRREASDAQQPINALASPTPFSRSKEDSLATNPPSLLLRRRTDHKDVNSGATFSERARVDTSADSSSFSSLKRSGPASASIHGPSSTWATTGPQSAGFGAFGSFSIDSNTHPGTPGEKRPGLGTMRSESRFKGLMSKESAEEVGKLREKNISILERLGETESELASRSHWTQQSLTAQDREHNAVEDLGRRIGSAALGGDDVLDGERNNESTDTDDERLSNPYSSRAPTKPFEPTYGGADRSQTSSAGPARFGGLSGLGGFGGIGSSSGWTANAAAVGNPSRSGGGFGTAFQDSIFNTMSDVSSPGGVFGTPPANAYSTIGRGSKMGSLFPQNLQEQMRGEHSFGDLGPPRGTGTPGHNAPSRDTESPARHNHGVLDDLFGSGDVHRLGSTGLSSSYSQTETFSASPAAAAGPLSSIQTSIAAPIAGHIVSSLLPSSSHDTSNSQMPAAQQRQMVMPDRMRWIYQDPQGNTQGPWSGLEMHDWYKAGFFSPELLVRKQEDNDYEPLAQLIRRIGNSREPFLVPQIGIPHGPPTGPPGVVAGAGASAMQSGVAQPPFASNFPSFGTTLTAEQQNALERRKQEEQFLMARQKEHLAQQQLIMRQYQNQGLPPHSMHSQNLHHHSSAHSLHSQPSYGSITSPAGYQASPALMPLQQQLQQQQQQPSQQPPISNGPNYYDRSGSTLGGYGGEATGTREHESLGSFDRLGTNRTIPSAPSTQAGKVHQSGVADHQERVSAMLQDRAWLQHEQDHAAVLDHHNENASLDRLGEYHRLRSHEDLGIQNEISETDSEIADGPILQPITTKAEIVEQPPSIEIPEAAEPFAEIITAPQELPQAPGPSISPLPAPSAQRTRHHVAEKLHVETESRSDTPSGETPTTATIAPWAKDNVDGPKGPSLKEIQEAEARKAAQQEEVAAAARRVLAEQERAAVAQAQAQNVAGLPSSSNWATTSPPAAVASSAWSKKTAMPISTASSKKTLSQIQKEEEARKTRAAAAAAATTSSSSNLSASASGKRYADLASKAVPPVTAASGGGAWTTVGAGGKPKTPASAAPKPAPQRTASINAPAAVPAASAKLVTPVRVNSGANSKQMATDELQRWAKASLGKGLNPGIDVDEFVRHLLTFPPDGDIVADSVYGYSKTLDGRRFAEEFVRRRKLADKGQMAPEGFSNFQIAGSNANSITSAGDNKAGGGWSEVAKKGGEKTGPREEAAAFKVVAAKKKGRR